MVLVALPLLALAYTHSPLTVAGVMVAGRLPALLVSLPAGALADRVNRRQLIVTIEVCRFAVLAAFGVAVLSRTGGIIVLYLAAFLLGALTIAFQVVSTACLPSMVDQEHLVSANARLMNAQVTGEGMIGQAIGGAVFSVVRAVPFLADALSFAASGALLQRAVPDNEPKVLGESMWGGVATGLRWFKSQPLIRLITAIVSSLAFCQAMVFAVLVIYATQRLDLTAAGFGLLMGVSYIGDVVGAFVSARLYRRLGGAACIGLAGCLAALTYPALALTRSAIVASGALIIEAIAVVVGIVASRSLRQQTVPAEMQGRAASANQMLVMGAVPLGGLLGGLLTAQLGVRTTLVVAGVAQFAIMAVAAPRLVGKLRANPLTLDLRDRSIVEQSVEALAS